MHKNDAGRVLKLAAAALLGGALALGGTATAHAAGTTIDESKPTSLTIHKYEQPATATGLPNDGRELAASDLGGLKPLSGVEFTVQKVPGIDLTTNDGWKAAQGLSTDAAKTAVADVTGTRGTTGADGTYRFTGLPLGLYYVSETSTPSGVTPAAPFLVTLPLTDPVDSSSWLYDVHVYPKNFAAHSDKTVEDAEGVQKVGDDVTWKVTSVVPADGTDGLQLSDTLDKRLDYKSVAVTIGSTPLAAADYTVATKDSAATGRTTVTVALTATGLAKANANKGATITFDLVTTINAPGEIANVAEIFNNADDIANKTPSDYTPGHPDADDPKPVPDDPDPQPGPDAPSTKFGEATLSKVAAADAAKLLAGATFQVYASEADAKAGTNPIVIQGVSSWTTDAEGKASISGLRYSNWENGVELTDTADWQHYWLVETKAPVGYELLSAPVRFDITSNAATEIDLTVENVETNAGFTLPLTGGSGIMLMTIGGGVLVLGAVLLALRNRRKAEVV